MRKLCLGLGMVLAVSACGDPMRNVPRLSEVEVATEAGQADVLAPEDSGEALPQVAASGEAPKRGLLGFLKRKADAATAPDPAADAITAPVAGEGAAMGAEGADEIVIAVSDDAPAAVPEKRGLFGFFGGGGKAEAEPVAAALGSAVLVDADTPAVELTDVDVAESAPEMAPTAEAEIAPEVAAEAAPAKRGLFGFLRAGAAAEGVSAAQPTTQSEAEPEVQLAVAVLPEEKPAQRGGLFGGGRPRAKAGGAPKPGAPDFKEVAFGTTVPYGQIARVCGVSESQLGAKTQSWPERGRGYELRDSAPGSTSARSYYLTGFKDGCARQFTAALVMFGSPETWEQIHYGPAGSSLPVLSTDRAFEDIKARICRVKKGQSCGSKMSTLEKDTVFVSFYERFEDNTRWTNILLHDGEVVALDGKR
ncbi:hypothetical protein [Sagittula sp. S175]|uniref:hypothetical protein n=1 Tax=Sagittula sp. S175 TaxID=3415129 RepID=UPI003C7CB25D